MNIAELQQMAHAQARQKGWYQGHDAAGTPNGRNIPELLALAHSELSEALECYREHGARVDKMIIHDGDVHTKPEGLLIELADCVIRIGDLAEYLGGDLEAAILLKLRHNETRTHRHGGLLA